MQPAQDSLSLGLDYVRRAVQEDSANDVDGAVRDYDSAIFYLTQALQDPRHSANQITISQKIREYSDRRVSFLCL